MAQVTRVEAPAEVEARREAPRASVIDLGRAVRWAAIGGVATSFVAATGMVQSFSAREVVNPVLTLGYLALFFVPFIFGYLAGSPPPQLEGYAPSRRGPRNVLAGLIAGTGSGVVLALFALFFSVVNLRRIFVNISPALIDNTLAFGLGLGPGLALLVLICAVAGTAGASLHVIPARFRRPTTTALLWVLTVGLLRDLVAQIFRGIGLPSLNNIFFAPGGGLSLRGVVLVAVLTFALEAFLQSRRTSVRDRLETLAPAQRRAFAAAAVGATILVLAITPVILGRFMSEILDLVGIFLLMALGLNIVVGYAGLLDLGYVAFFAVGAYSTAVLTSPDSPTFSPEMVFWVALPFVMLAAAFSGVIVGTPVLRMRGDYLAIVTLGFGEIARILFLSDWFSPVFGGAQGITRIPGIQVGEATLQGPQEFFYPIAALVLVTAYISWALYRSRIGRAWTAMREDEPVAEAVGVNIVSAKLSAFIIGAVLASFGGAVFASKIGAIFPNSFSIVVSIVVLVIIIVGGMGSLVGVAVGALVIQGVPQLLREFEEYQFLLYGALLIFMMLVRPEGLVPSKERAQELHQEEMTQDSWLTQEQEQEEKEEPVRSRDRHPEAGLT